jgi:hypothetical protein
MRACMCRKRKMLKESAREMQLLAKCRGEAFFQLFVSKLDTVGVQMVTKDGLTYDAAGDIFSDVSVDMSTRRFSACAG